MKKNVFKVNDQKKKKKILKNVVKRKRQYDKSIIRIPQRKQRDKQGEAAFKEVMANKISNQ